MTNNTQVNSPALVPMTNADFIEFPTRSIVFNGVTLTRSTLWRAMKRGEIKSSLFRVPGSLKGRRLILRESLQAWLNQNISEAPVTAN